jgi:hypothetical protein
VAGQGTDRCGGITMVVITRRKDWTTTVREYNWLVTVI